MSITRIQTVSNIWLINTTTKKCTQLPLGDTDIDPLMAKWETYEAMLETERVLRIKIGNVWHISPITQNGESLE